MRLERIPRWLLVTIVMIVAVAGLLLMSYLGRGCGVETVGQWTEQIPSGASPSPRTGQALVYDESSGEFVMFGGMYAESPEGDWTHLDDTWTYDPVARTWTEILPSGEVPSGRAGHVMAYDSDTETILLFGGYDEATEYTGLNDLWEYDPVGKTWSELEPGGSRPGRWVYQLMVYDSRSHRSLLLGSREEPEDSIPFEYVNELWAYDRSGNVWTKVEPEGESRPALVLASMSYDADTGYLLVDGGFYASWDENDPVESFQRIANDTLWIYDTATNVWTDAKPGGNTPPQGPAPYLVYDPALKRTVLFVQGVTESGDLVSGMWLYDAAENEWTRAEPMGETPPVRGAGSLAFWPGGPGLVLYGGNRLSQPDAPADQVQPYVYPSNVWVFTVPDADQKE